MLQVDHALVEHRPAGIEHLLLAAEPAPPRRDAARAVPQGARQRSPRLDQVTLVDIEHHRRGPAIDVGVVGHRGVAERAPFAIALVVAHEGEARAVRVDDAHAVMVGGGRPPIVHRRGGPTERAVGEPGGQHQQGQPGGRIGDWCQGAEAGNATRGQARLRQQAAERRQADGGGTRAGRGEGEEAAASESRPGRRHWRTSIDVARTCHSRPGAVAWPPSRV
jgi:hypothetical protein